MKLTNTAKGKWLLSIESVTQDAAFTCKRSSGVCEKYMVKTATTGEKVEVGEELLFRNCCPIYR